MFKAYYVHSLVPPLNINAGSELEARFILMEMLNRAPRAKVGAGVYVSEFVYLQNMCFFGDITIDDFTFEEVS